MNATSPLKSATPVAVLGTLAEFHREPIPYDLAALVQLVCDLHPDLLCLDMTLEQWQRRDFSELPPEYREALLPLAHQTDIVVVPIGDEDSLQEATVMGWRGWAIAALRHGLAYLQRHAPGPAAINEGLHHVLADALYEVIGWLAGRTTRQAWEAHIHHLTQHVLDVARRDPSCRILVAVNVRFCHHIRHALKRHPEVHVVRYTEL